jgi:transketolase C-terminal domain/subunit
LTSLARHLSEASDDLVFWSGVGFLEPTLPESLTSSVGQEWSEQAAKAYLSYLSVSSSETFQETGKRLSVVLACPCHPSQLHGLVVLADAGLLSSIVLLERRKPKSLGGVFEKRDSATGDYLKEIGVTDCGWVEWDSSDKSVSRLRELTAEAQLESPAFMVACCRDQEASEEPLSLVSSETHFIKRYSQGVSGAPPLETVFGRFLKSLESMVPRESIFWVPEEIEELEEFRRQLSLFRRIQQGTPGRPVMVLESAVLPIVYADIRNWCESPDRDNPVFLVYHSGLPAADSQTAGGLTDGLLLQSIPGLNLSVPADEEEAKTLFSEADELTGPAALTFCRNPAVGLSLMSKSKPGQGRMLREGKDLALVAIGSTVFPCLLAAESLRAVGLSVAVVDLRYRKPLDRKLIESLNRFPLLVSVDEHPEAGSISGHLWRPESAKCKLIRLGIEVEQVQSLVDAVLQEDLTLEHFGLHAEGIARIVRENLRLAPPTAFG